MRKSTPNAQIAKSDRDQKTEVAKPIPAEKRRALIKMAYIGAVITQNHYLGRNGKAHYVKAEAADWQNDLIWEIKRCGIQDWREPLHVKLSGVFKNKRECPDLINMKLLFDGIQKATGLNDKFYSTETNAPVINNSVEPYILIEIREV